MKKNLARFAAVPLLAALLCSVVPGSAMACTRTLYVGADGLVITGRNMDWEEDMGTNLWVFPAGMARNGASGPNSLTWTSKYGSVLASGYDVGTADGMNEKGLVTNLLYLAESQYPKPVAGKPYLSISLWAQYVLDNFATWTRRLTHCTPSRSTCWRGSPHGAPTALHLAISDATGDSAILEYVDGELTIHHGKQYVVMTNSPIYSQQLALNAYWANIGGLKFLPGTNSAADRFARASFCSAPFRGSSIHTTSPAFRISRIPTKRWPRS